MNKNKNIGMCIAEQSISNFANEAQFLLISEESIFDLNNRISTRDVQKGTEGVSFKVNPMRFRPNLVISGGEPYAEDGWRNLRIRNKYFSVSYQINCLNVTFA
jgi:molybdenum cofactor sulfurtransferase